MSEQRIDAGAAAGAGTDADTGEGQGLNTPAAHPGGPTGGGSGEAGDQPVPGHGERSEPAGATDTPDTEGARFAAQTTDIAESQQRQPADLSGVDPDAIPEEPPASGPRG